jgi:hypothetical protein
MVREVTFLFIGKKTFSRQFVPGTWAFNAFAIHHQHPNHNLLNLLINPIWVVFYLAFTLPV